MSEPYPSNWHDAITVLRAVGQCPRCGETRRVEFDGVLGKHVCGSCSKQWKEDAGK